MGRSKTLPDTDVFAALRRLLIQGGDKAVAFSSVGQATGLAAPTLAQRYGTRDAMVRAALQDGWDVLGKATEQTVDAAPPTAKGATQILKALSASHAEEIALLVSEFRDPALRDPALAWRQSLLAALGSRLGGGSKGQEAAALVFSAWQGQILWHKAGGSEVKIKDAVKRLT
jgi:AcrR family transcriptional regulator